MKRIDPNKPRFRSLWISDVHLGMKASRPHCLADFLTRHDADTIYLLGDIVDGLRLKQKWNWTESCNEVVHLLLEKARSGTKIIYIPGNHDAFLRSFAGESLSGIRIEKELEHVTADGRLFHMQHGDAFDGVIRLSPVAASVGTVIYHVATFANTLINAVRSRLGFGYWSLAKFLKTKSRKAQRYIHTFEQALINDARRRKANGVICGHIHQPAFREDDGITYINTGDWVDHCTLLTEHRDGSMELLTWDESKIDRNRSEDRVAQVPSGITQQLMELRVPEFED